jgi:ribulose 1,5-bisphosphate carboxylase large subunit-like protein
MRKLHPQKWIRKDLESHQLRRLVMELIAKYHVETDLPIQKVAAAIAVEQSAGTWTEVQGADNPLAARVISADGTEVEIGFPEELFEPGNVPQYLSVVAVNLFGLAALIASLCDRFSLSAPLAFSAAHQPA